MGLRKLRDSSFEHTEISSAVSMDTKIAAIGSHLEKTIQCLVPYPETVSVSFERGEKTTVFKVSSSQKNLGHLMGKKGTTIQALRKVFSSITALQGFRSVIEIPYFPNE